MMNDVPNVQLVDLVSAMEKVTNCEDYPCGKGDCNGCMYNNELFYTNDDILYFLKRLQIMERAYVLACRKIDSSRGCPVEDEDILPTGTCLGSDCDDDNEKCWQRYFIKKVENNGFK